MLILKQKNMNLIYNKDLANRFVSDYKLPIQLTDEKYFFYFLDLYEKEFKSLTKYANLCNLIKNRFNNNPNLFLDEYYKVRDTIIKTVENSEAYHKFNTMDMSCFAIKNKKNITSNNIYNEQNVGKLFVSFDLKKANFQALKYVNPEIVMNTVTYEDFIRKFTGLDYIAGSKYCRQVIWGKLNPKRHITVEKYIIDKIYEELANIYKLENCVSMSNDELVFYIGDTYMKTDMDVFSEKVRYETIRQLIKSSLGFELNVEVFELHKLQLSCDKFQRSPYYYKEYKFAKENEPKGKLMCVPMNYFAIVYKLFNHFPLQEEDYHFDYEGLDCRYCEDFKLSTTYKDFYTELFNIQNQ